MDKARIHEMLEKMTEWALSEMQAKGKEGVDTKEMGEVIDMVKDLADAEKSVYEKCYYESIINAMEDYGEEEGRAGYDRWRYSSGRFAPKGHGHETSMAMATGRAGFDGGMPYRDDPNLWPPIMGYNAGGRNDQGSTGARADNGARSTNDAAARMGYTPPEKDWSQYSQDKRSQYHDARRYFHESGSEQDRHSMTEKGKEYVIEAAETMKDMFTEADPELQKAIRDNIFRLYREFGGK